MLRVKVSQKSCWFFHFRLLGINFNVHMEDIFRPTKFPVCELLICYKINPVEALFRTVMLSIDCLVGLKPVLHILGRLLSSWLKVASEYDWCQFKRDKNIKSLNFQHWFYQGLKCIPVLDIGYGWNLITLKLCLNTFFHTVKKVIVLLKASSEVRI